MSDQPVKQKRTVWDLPTRVFHWSLVAMVGLAWVSAEFDGFFFWLHVVFGEAVIALVVFRLVWGFIGGRYARFFDFVAGPAAVKAHLGSLLTRTPHHVPGHNPAAGWMILVLLAVSFATSFAGLFLIEDGYIGPLARYGNLDDDPHEALADILVFLIGLHVAAAVLMSLLMGENLIRAMWTGKKTGTDDAAPTTGAPVEAPLWRAGLAALIGLAAAIFPFFMG